jgi:hypothetical protein
MDMTQRVDNKNANALFILYKYSFVNKIARKDTKKSWIYKIYYPFQNLSPQYHLFN